MRNCLYCSIELNQRHKIKYCSNKCQSDFKYKEYILNWKKDSIRGGRGIKTKNISGYLKRYLLEKHNYKCSKCGWNKKHPITGRPPLEVEHVDGDSENNHENNLDLLCPNCHSLTSSFRNLNKGKGRRWRKDGYIKNKS